jgi:hypothetical protein
MPTISKEFQDVVKLKDNGSNWKIFSTRIMIAARSMGIEDQLTKAAITPSGSKTQDDIESEKRQLLNAIVQKLPDVILAKHISEDTPYKLWQALKTKFGTTTIVNTAAIEAKMFSLTCKDGRNMRTYLDKMLQYKQELVDANSSISNKQFRNAIIVGAQSAGPAYIAVIELLSAAYEAAGQTSKLTSALFINLL